MGNFWVVALLHSVSSQTEGGLLGLALMSNESRIQKSVVQVVVFCDFVLEVRPPHSFTFEV